MVKNNIRSLDSARKKKELQKIVDAILEDLECDPYTLEEMTGDLDLRDSIEDAIERRDMYRHLNVISAEEDEANGVMADECHNAVCPQNRREDKRSYCADGLQKAQECLYRAQEQPLSDPWQRIPSHAEAIRMLQRAELLKPDEYGKYNGTDFMLQQNTRKIWMAYVNLLVETKKINKAVFKTSEGDQLDWDTLNKEAKKILLKE